MKISSIERTEQCFKPCPNSSSADLFILTLQAGVIHLRHSRYQLHRYACFLVQACTWCAWSWKEKASLFHSVRGWEWGDTQLSGKDISWAIAVAPIAAPLHVMCHLWCDIRVPQGCCSSCESDVQTYTEVPEQAERFNFDPCHLKVIIVLSFLTELIDIMLWPFIYLL